MILLLGFLAGVCAAKTGRAQFVPPTKRFAISPKATFYRTSNDAQAAETVPINLNTLPDSGSTSQILVIQVHGAYGATKDPAETKTTLYAMFSTTFPSLILRPPTIQNRVTDTVDFRSFAPLRFSPVTQPTFNGSLATDVPNDFIVQFNSSGVYRTKYGASAAPFRWLVLAVPDSYYSDNHDSNNDFAVTMRLDSVKPEDAGGR